MSNEQEDLTPTPEEAPTEDTAPLVEEPPTEEAGTGEQPEDFDSSQSMGSRRAQAERSADEVAGNSNSALGVPVQDVWRCKNCVDFRLNAPNSALVDAHMALHPA